MINSKNHRGETALIAAIAYKDYTKAIYLINLGADVTLKNDNSQSALDYILFHTKLDTLYDCPQLTPEAVPEEVKQVFYLILDSAQKNLKAKDFLVFLDDAMQETKSWLDGYFLNYMNIIREKVELENATLNGIEKKLAKKI